MIAWGRYSEPHEWPSRIDRAISAGFDPGEDYDQPAPAHLRPPAGVNALAVFAAQADHALGITRCTHPHCRTSLTDDDTSRCPHNRAFCDMCVWEDGCDECANGITDWKEGA